MTKQINSKNQYELALERIYNLMQKEIKSDSKETDELEVLSILVEKYEDENYKIDLPG